MNKFIKKINFIKNFSSCENWEEKYLYIIELGNKLSPFPEKFRKNSNLIPGCQNDSWIYLIYENTKKIKFYGDSNSLIVKGLIAIIFILHEDLKLSEILTFDVKPYFNKLSLTNYLTPSRVQGLSSISKFIKKSARCLLIKEKIL
ncbi:ynhA [Wigglesworthia glossinidia endosymbiont of Glossina brevipalpis]|uniref:Cysteine desulfuration protein SufE n=1 Tax=Wigglesworthia glossinidia brevipalpis TaxID=36870 RepID=SUFE_WIGBR|nr:RecName: Full=Cysteine desulfuration protein SufE [Wigglesworthia glossinidia endosymbiont of Glossina brevipalpis]BAC24502.1 ynhA [Wigglesworthia glossinidia endosymbiont of Glossina brevipalpis]